MLNAERGKHNTKMQATIYRLTFADSRLPPTVSHLPSSKILRHKKLMFFLQLAVFIQFKLKPACVQEIDFIYQ